MELTEWNSTALRFGYYDADGTTIRYQSTQFGDQDIWRIYAVTLAIHHEDGQTYQLVGGEQYTDAQVYAACATTNFKLTASRTADSQSLAKFFAATSSTMAAAEGSQPLDFQASQVINSTNIGKTYYVGVYVDGGEHAKDVTTNTGNFTITMANA